MEFITEADLEAYARKLIRRRVTDRESRIYVLDNKKAVDILICRDGLDPGLYFIEVKLHKRSSGRLGFGSAKGLGFQPEIVRRKPEYFENNLRWLIASDFYSPGRFLFLSSDIVRQYIAGGEVGERFNNIQERIFRDEKMLGEEELASALEEWLLPNNAQQHAPADAAKLRG